jgi:hypothetical protein
MPGTRGLPGSGSSPARPKREQPAIRASRPGAKATMAGPAWRGSAQTRQQREMWRRGR